MYKRQVSQVTEAGTRIEREYYIDQALTTIQKKKGRDRRKRWCRLLSGETPEPLIPGYTSTVRRSRGECMKTSTHSIAAGVSTVAKLHWLRVLSTLKLFSVNHKNSPLPSLFLFPWFPQFSLDSHTTRHHGHRLNRIDGIFYVVAWWLLLFSQIYFSTGCLSPAIVRGYRQNYSSVDFASFSRIIYKDITVNIFIRLHLISLFIYESRVNIIRENIYDVIVTIHEKIRMYIHISELILYRVDSMILILFLDAIWNN